MVITTPARGGAVVFATLDQAQSFAEPGDHVFSVAADPESLAELTRRVRLGTVEQERRKARRKMQAASRRRNRH